MLQTSLACYCQSVPNLGVGVGSWPSQMHALDPWPHSQAREVSAAICVISNWTQGGSPLAMSSSRISPSDFREGVLLMP